MARIRLKKIFLGLTRISQFKNPKSLVLIVIEKVMTIILVDRRGHYFVSNVVNKAVGLQIAKSVFLLIAILIGKFFLF